MTPQIQLGLFRRYIGKLTECLLRTKLYDRTYYFNFPIVNFLSIRSNIPAAPAHGVYISQLIGNSRACCAYHAYSYGTDD